MAHPQKHKNRRSGSCATLYYRAFLGYPLRDIASGLSLLPGFPLLGKPGRLLSDTTLV
jgi:hypothetical protein